MGGEVVLHATATGKAWLATLSEDEALRLVVARGFPFPRERGHPIARGADAAAFGKAVVRTIDELRTHLKETRRRGYGLAIEEGEPGIVAMASVFRASEDPRAAIAGTVSVAGPLLRLGPSRRDKIAPLLSAAANDLSALWPLRQHQAGIPHLPDARSTGAAKPRLARGASR